MDIPETRLIRTSHSLPAGRCNRRRFIMAAAALAIPLLPLTGKAAQEQIEFPTSLSRSDKIYTGDEYGLTVTWDPSLWQVKYEFPSGSDGIGLLDADVDMNDASTDSWLIQVEYQTDHRWTTVEDMKKNSMFEYFSDGMEDSTIVEQWETPEARSWFHTSDVRNRQSLNYVEYSAVDAPNAIWRYIAISIDNAVFDDSQAISMFKGFMVDNDKIPRATDLGTLVNQFNQHAG